LRLTFTALPVNPTPRAGLGGIRGPGRARIVDNATGMRHALDSKANKCGDLDSPLVIAALSNTEYPTRSSDWLDRVDVDGPESAVHSGSPLDELFGLPPDWLAGDPDFA
jgi:hypothetical protein